MSHPRAAAEGQPETAAAQKLVIILIKPAARQVVLIQQVLVPADLIRFLTAVAELAHDVNLVVTPLLLTGVPFIQPVTAIAVKTEQFNLVTADVVVQGAAVRVAARYVNGAAHHLVPILALTPKTIFASNNMAWIVILTAGKTIRIAVMLRLHAHPQM